VLYSFPDTLGKPGIGTTALNQVRGMVARGHDVTVCCTSSRVQVPGARILQTLVVGGRRIPHRALGVDRSYRFHDRHVARRLRRAGDAVDVVHGWPLGSLETLRVARDQGLPGLREAPNCYTPVAYEIAARESTRLGVELPKGASHRPDPRRVEREEAEYDAATAVLAPSPFVAETFERRDGAELRVLRHRYGFDPASFPHPDDITEHAGFTLVFVGTGEPRKGLHHALAAWAGAADELPPSARFVICGSVYPEYRRVIADQLSQPGVVELGQVVDVGSVLRDADALVLPSLEEGSALVTYEAQASGCCLLVSDAAGALMTDGVHGLIHRAGDVDTLTQHLRLVVADTDLRQHMRKQALEHRDELTWDAAAARLEQVYLSQVQS
jgi:glycosyltransferase involved in cell wall biosynthesis